MFDSLLKILREEIDLYNKVLHVSQVEKDAMLRSDLDEIHKATYGEAVLRSRIEDLEQKRRSVVKDLARIFSRDGERLSLHEICELAEEPYSTQFANCREHLLELAGRLSDINYSNKKLITHRLALIRGRLSFLNNLPVVSPVYHSTGKMLMTSRRIGRVLSAEF